MSKGKKTVTFEELVVSNTLEIQAIIRILERKGLITADEVLEEVSTLKEEMDEKIRRMGGRIRNRFWLI
ncbi:MAG: hypothetical protein P8Z35_14060 [Ignavibacteriaceae bacterium]